MSSRIDHIDGGAVAKSLFSKLLKANPAERLGVQEGGTDCILEHQFFSGMDFQSLQDKTTPAPLLSLANEQA